MLRKYAPLLLGVAVVGGLVIISSYNYLLFHSLVEIFSIIVACGIFIIAWNSRHTLDNSYLGIVGIAYLVVAVLDLLHTLSYKGMGVFQTGAANLPTQLWIAARYIESLTLCIAPLFLKRRINLEPALLYYLGVCCTVLAAIFYFEIFPDSYLEGTGLTPFKIVSEVIISFLFFCAIVQLLLYRRAFDTAVLRFLIGSLLLSIAAEVAFIFYVDVYGISNLLGHIMKFASFFLIYRALIITGLVRPFDLLYTNLKRSESSLRESERRLSGLNTAKDRFFSIIAHDLRSPTSSMQTGTQYLMSELGSLSEDEQRGFLQDLNLTSQHILDLLDNLLLWAKCQTGDIQVERKTYRLHPLIGEAVAALRGSARNKGIELELIEQEHIRVLVDRNMFSTVLRNLVSNAIKFSFPNSTVYVEAKKRADGEMVEIRVRDSGMGIRAADIDKLFKVDQKHSTKGTAREKGTGLGLALCRDFIELNGGSIHVESVVRKGTSVTFTVPAAGT
jgi:signal transduction histidine kinase